MPVIFPGTELRLVDEHTGYGVFATATIPAGTVVWVHDELDQVFSPARVATLPAILQQQVQRYAYVNANGDRVLCWDHGRYMNHSCEPTTTSIGTLMEIARRDIQPGEELTCEYGLAYVTEGVGRQGDDGGVPSRAVFAHPQGACGLVPVHDRHLAVHQHQVVL